MAFDRITQDEISQNGVVSAPDKLTGTAADNKAIFDKLIKNIVAREFNKLLDDLEAATGAASIGAAPFDGVEGKNIQDQLKNVQSNVSTSFDGKAMSVSEMLTTPATWKSRYLLRSGAMWSLWRETLF